MLRLTTLPLLLALALYGSEPPPTTTWERFELTDGRVLVGEYNPITEVFTVEGGVATLSVPGALIKSRGPASPTAPSAKKMTKEEKEAAMAALADRIAAAARARALADADKMDAEADALLAALRAGKVRDPEERAKATNKVNALRRAAEEKRAQVK